jgi:hypothetical protein
MLDLPRVDSLNPEYLDAGQLRRKKSRPEARSKRVLMHLRNAHRPYLAKAEGSARPKAELAAAKFDATKPPFKAASKQSGLD